MTALSKNFTLEEFLVSQTAERHGIDMTPPVHVIDNLRLLVGGVMQPLRDDLGRPIFISSGYRPYDLNRMIGGSETSEHVNGNACDFVVLGMTPYETAKRMQALQLPYDQLIHEFGRWVHVGVRDTLRHQDLTAYRDHGQTRYVAGISRIEDLV